MILIALTDDGQVTGVTFGPTISQQTPAALAPAAPGVPVSVVDIKFEVFPGTPGPTCITDAFGNRRCF